MPRDRGQSRGGLAVLGCPAPGSLGQSASELEALYPVAYVLQDFLTVTSGIVDTRRRPPSGLPWPGGSP